MIRPLALPWLGAALLTMLYPKCAAADLTTVTGYHWVDYDFHLDINITTTTSDFDQVRFTVPTVHSESLAQNYWGQYGGATISVRAQGGGSVNWQTFAGLDPYNPGEVNSGYWIRVFTPTPGQSFSYIISIRINGFSDADQAAYRHDASRALSPNSVIYYSGPTPTVDSDSPSIVGIANAALTNPSWPGSSLVPGPNRADLERITLRTQALNYSGTILSGAFGRTASTVFALGGGVCDDLVKAECALLRASNFNARCVLTGQLSTPVPNLMPVAPTASLHAIGQYWDGTYWNSFEPGVTENFATANQVWLGAANDFQELYSVFDGESPAHLLTPTFAGTSTSFVGTYSVINNRALGVLGREVALAEVVAGAPQPAGDPSDARVPPTTATPPRDDSPHALAITTAGVSREHIRLLVTAGHSGVLRVSLFDVQGRQLGQPHEFPVTPGQRIVEWAQPELEPGLYLVGGRLDRDEARGKVVVLGMRMH